MSRHRESIVVRHPVNAELVPSGQPIELQPGTVGEITQALGSSFTLYVEGQLMRIAGADAEAIGKEVPKAPELPDDAGPEELRALVWQTLKTCYDPEIPVDIVELGLIYVCDILPLDDDRYWVSIKMTLTAPGCGMGDTIANEVPPEDSKSCRASTACVSRSVFDPPWDPLPHVRGRAALPRALTPGA